MKGENVMSYSNFNGNCNSGNGGLKQAVYHMPTTEDLAQHANEMEKTQNAIATVGSDMLMIGSAILDANQSMTVATDTLKSFVTKTRKKKGVANWCRCQENVFWCRNIQMAQRIVKTSL